jgi:hypothetical protein
MPIPPEQQDEEQLIHPKIRLRKAPRGTTVNDESHVNEGIDLDAVYFQDRDRKYSDESEPVEAKEG